MKKNIILVVGFVAVAIIAFYGGNAYGGSKRGSISTQTQNFRQIPGDQRMQASVSDSVGKFSRGGNNAVMGEIVSIDDKNITIKTNDGGSKVVFFDSKTTVAKSVSGQMKDVIAGEQVSVFGSNNQDGSFNAQSIQIRPKN